MMKANLERESSNLKSQSTRGLRERERESQPWRELRIKDCVRLVWDFGFLCEPMEYCHVGACECVSGSDGLVWLFQFLTDVTVLCAIFSWRCFSWYVIRLRFFSACNLLLFYLWKLSLSLIFECHVNMIWPFLFDVKDEDRYRL